MKQKEIVFFMPSIEGGGVEKNLFIISNYFASKINNIFNNRIKNIQTNLIEKLI